MHTFTWGSCAGTSVPPDGEYILSVNAEGTLTGTQPPSRPLIAQPNEDAFYYAFARPKNIKINGEASYEGDTVQEFGSGDVEV
ncbi:MAG: hypothetical protein KQI35_16680 [Bacteroidetes bacterium]|nr:hypothetical protein [Bacteroidota bacterium]